MVYMVVKLKKGHRENNTLRFTRRTLIMNKGKIFTIILWVALGINYLLNFSIWVNYFAVLLLAIHLVEYLVFFKRIRNSDDNFISGIFQTLVFGVLYIETLKK
tara:strand:+ start:103 stop:411 length:309 start_codon:yes stop_codon:yes gene_type:complete